MPDKITQISAKVSQQAAQECVAYHTRRAMRALTTVYDKALSPLGIKGTQFTLLNAIHLLQQTTVNQLAEVLLIDRTTLTRNLRRLKGQGFIEMMVGADKREKLILLSGDGKDVLKQALPVWRSVHKRVQSVLGPDRLNRLLDDLEVVEKIT